jgi:hypothetical protein
LTAVLETDVVDFNLRLFHCRQHSNYASLFAQSSAGKEK